MADEYDTTELDASNPPSKADVHAAYADMTPGQKTAFNKTVKMLHDYEDNLANSFFGESINPDNLVGLLRGYARDNGLQPEFMHLALYNLIHQ